MRTIMIAIEIRAWWDQLPPIPPPVFVLLACLLASCEIQS